MGDGDTDVSTMVRTATNDAVAHFLDESDVGE